jgi:hypothetical protein
MNPDLMKMLIPFLAGAGLTHFAASIKKLKETMMPSEGAGAGGAKRPVPPALQAMLQAGQPPAQAAPSGGAPNLAALAQLLASRGAQ